MMTARGSEVAQLVASASLFPLIDDRGTILRGDIELVDQLLALPGITLGDTYRRRGGLPRLRLSTPGPPTECALPEIGCPITTFHRFSRKKAATCPHNGCPVGVGDAFVVHEQKMVDTLLACDLLEAASQGLGRVVLLTSDSDLLPPVLQASQLAGERLLLVGDEGLWSPEHLGLLESAGVSTAYRSDPS